MDQQKEEALKKEIIAVGKKLYDQRLVVARSGNLSCRLNERTILITATGTALGALSSDDIVRVELDNPEDLKNPRLTSEFPLHRAIYENFPAQAVIHCHPPLVNGYFAVYSDLKVLTFEAKFCLGNVPVIAQDTPSISKPELVVEGLKTNNIAVIRNHGVVSMSKSFTDSFYLVETLEEAVRVAATARLFKKEILDELDKELQSAIADTGAAEEMFSKEHVQKIVELVNRDTFLAQKGAELDLTLQLAIKLDGSDSVYKFNFQKGRISKLEFDEDAPFVISAPEDVWRTVFLGQVDPFVATVQGRMKLKGEMGKLSRWYVPFSRLFELFKEVKIK